MSAVLVSLMAVGVGMATILRPVSEASVVAEGGCCSVMSGGRSVVGMAVSGAVGAFPGVVVTVPRAGGTVAGAGMTVPGEGWFHSALRAATWPESSSTLLRSSLFSVGWPMLASAGGGTVSVIQFARSAAASRSAFGWQARVACTLAFSQLVLMVRR
jgi:hypothetical protein